jgi:cobalt-zinc-cadmium efflux system membrane fusion protein
MPLITVQDVSQLRISAAVTPAVAGTLRRGQSIDATVEGRAVRAHVEGVVPAAAGNLYTINALIPNRESAFLAGSTATLMVPSDERHALLVPSGAIITVGDLTGVTLRTANGNQRRWVRLGRTVGTLVEVSAGLREGDQIVIPNTLSLAAAAGS